MFKCHVQFLGGTQLYTDTCKIAKLQAAVGKLSSTPGFKSRLRSCIAHQQTQWTSIPKRSRWSSLDSCGCFVPKTVSIPQIHWLNIIYHIQFIPIKIHWEAISESDFPETKLSPCVSGWNRLPRLIQIWVSPQAWVEVTWDTMAQKQDWSLGYHVGNSNHIIIWDIIWYKMGYTSNNYVPPKKWTCSMGIKNIKNIAKDLLNCPREVFPHRKG